MQFVSRTFSFARSNALLLPALIFLAGVFVVPLIGVVLTAFHAPHFSLAAFEYVFANSIYREVIATTFEISLLTTVCAAVAGYPIAYLIHGSGKRVKIALYMLVMLSFWVSMIVRSFAWITILGSNGILSTLFQYLGADSTLDGLLYGEFSVVVGMANVLLPFMIFPILGTMDSIDTDLPNAGATLGAPPWQAFFRIFLPLSLPGLAAGCMLVFVLSLGFYITPTLLGGPDSVMISQIISRDVNETLNWPVAAAVSTLLLAATFGGVAIFNKLVGIDQLFG